MSDNSDWEILGLAIAAGSRIHANNAYAQRIIDKKNNEIAALERRLARAHRQVAELRGERTDRHIQMLAAHITQRAH